MPRGTADFCNKFKRINALSTCAAILTWLYAVSMVRAVSKGGGALISGKRSEISGVDSMADGTRDSDSGNGSRDNSPDEAALSARLGSLNHRLSELRDNRQNQTDQPGNGGNGAARASAMALGFRLSSELVAGVVVGALIGWGIDRLLSTSPWGLIVFLLLGFTAGVVNVIRSAGAASDKQSR
jgi:F0F1-type ATP synthase assembly protein I